MPDPFIPNPILKPAIIVCPGGAYQTCPRHGNEGDPVAMTFAVDGYQAFVLEYSVATKTSQQNMMFPSPNGPILSQMAQMRVLHLYVVSDTPVVTFYKQSGKLWKNGLRNCSRSVLRFLRLLS